MYIIDYGIGNFHRTKYSVNKVSTKFSKLYRIDYIHQTMNSKNKLYMKIKLMDAAILK